MANVASEEGGRGRWIWGDPLQSSPARGGAEGDGGGGRATYVIAFLPLRLASASHLPLAGEDRNLVGDLSRPCSTAPPRRRPGPNWETSPTERSASLLRPFHLGPGVRRGGGNREVVVIVGVGRAASGGPLPLDDRPDLRRQRFHRERFGDHRHPRLEEARRQRGILRIAGHEQDAEVGAQRTTRVGDLVTVETG